MYGNVNSYLSYCIWKKFMVCSYWFITFSAKSWSSTSIGYYLHAVGTILFSLLDKCLGILTIDTVLIHLISSDWNSGDSSRRSQ